MIMFPDFQLSFNILQNIDALIFAVTPLLAPSSKRSDGRDKIYSENNRLPMIMKIKCEKSAQAGK